MNKQISIGQFRSNISYRLNHAATSGECVILTSDGKPMAALVSMHDYERQRRSENRAIDIQKWLADTCALPAKLKSSEANR